MDRIDAAAIQLLNRVRMIAMFWVWTVTKLSICAVTYVALLAGSPDPSVIPVLQLLCVARLG